VDEIMYSRKNTLSVSNVPGDARWWAWRASLYDDASSYL
jgi:hypothetical protein